MTDTLTEQPASIERRDALPWLEGTLLCAMRMWVLGCKRGVPTDDQVRWMFAMLRSSDAAEYLCRFMRALNTGCTRMIEVNCLCDPGLTADEVTLLDVLALEQEHREGDAIALLMGFVDAASASDATGNALGVIQVLRDAGHHLTRGAVVIQRRALVEFDAPAARGASTRLN